MDFELQTHAGEEFSVLAHDARWERPLRSARHAQDYLSGQSAHSAAYLLAQEMNKCVDGHRLGDQDFAELHQSLAVWLQTSIGDEPPEDAYQTYKNDEINGMR